MPGTDKDGPMSRIADRHPTSARYDEPKSAGQPQRAAPVLDLCSTKQALRPGRLPCPHDRAGWRGRQAAFPSPRPHAPPFDRLRTGRQRNGYAPAPALPRPSSITNTVPYTAHEPGAVQGHLARLTEGEYENHLSTASAAGPAYARANLPPLSGGILVVVAASLIAVLLLPLGRLPWP
jgi:hypothetical protein